MSDGARGFATCVTALALMLGLAAGVGRAQPGAGESRFQIAADEAGPDAAHATVTVTVASDADGRPLPVRAVVTGADGKHYDGNRYGLYADGRFFADGLFTVTVPAGEFAAELRAGPDYVPLTIKTRVAAGRRVLVAARLHRWFSPEARGWYGGDSHVHQRHNREGAIQNDGPYTALMGRAQGLSYISQASKGNEDPDPGPLTTKGFLWANARELGGGCFIGHLITPGIRTQIPTSVWVKAFEQPLSAQPIMNAARELGGALTYTHPIIPPYQLHWMGATEFYSDVVLRHAGDAYDVDGRATELLWFAALNLGARIAASGSTDSSLERADTLTPGDRRVYSHTRDFGMAGIVSAIRQGRTFATSGGPVFPFFTIDGHEPGDTLAADGHAMNARIELHSLYPLRSVELVRRGRVVQSFPVAGKQGELTLAHPITEKERSWYVVRAENERGEWAITSPLYFEPPQASPARAGAAVLLEIGNMTREMNLRKDFFAHILVTVAPEERLTAVTLMKDGKELRRFAPAEGDHVAAGQTPVNGQRGEYAPGWLWHPAANRAVHFQADWPVKETGWYAVRATTAAGKTLTSDACRFNTATANTHELMVAHLWGPDFRLDRWGYGEDVPLADIRPAANDEAYGWYPANAYWRESVVFDGQPRNEGAGLNDPRAKESFRQQ